MDGQRHCYSRRAFLGTAAAGMAGVALGERAPGATHSVSDLMGLKKTLEETAKPGDLVLLQPGMYELDVRRLPVRRSGRPGRPITLRGVSREGRRPVLDGGRVNVDRGLLYFPPETHDWVVENVELRNARGSGRPGPEYSNNAAAAYILGS